MKTVKSLLFGSGKNVQKRTVFWNMCSSVVYSVQSMILLWIVTRVGGLYQAGVFSIIYTITQTLASLGSYSMRNFQVSDAKGKYRFEDYFSSRVITCGLMLMCVLFYALYQRMPWDQLLVIVLFGVYRAVDGMEDVYHGAVQKAGRLDVVSIAMAVRIVMATLTFGIVYLITKNLLVASMSFCGMAVILFMYLNRIILQEYTDLHSRISFKRIGRLLVECFPVFLGAILYNYLVNAPKYAINRNLSEEAQTIFNIIFMPVFVINVLSSFIFKPLIGNMGRWWNNHEIGKFVHVILRQCIFIVVLTLVMVAGGYLCGCPILSFVFGVDLGEYRSLLCLLLCFGGVTALDAFLSMVLTVIRKQIYIIVGYLIAFGVNMVFVDTIVIRSGLAGAGLVYGLVMGVVLFVFTAATVVHIILNYRQWRKS